MRYLTLLLLSLGLLAFPLARPAAAAVSHPTWTKCTVHLDWATMTRVTYRTCTNYTIQRETRRAIGHTITSTRLSPHVIQRVHWPVFYHPAPTQPTGGYRTTLSVSAYAPGCGASGAMADGQWPFVGAAAGTYPFGTRIAVPGWGTVSVLDRGVPGGYLDLYMSSCGAAVNWGRQNLTVTVYR